MIANKLNIGIFLLVVILSSHSLAQNNPAKAVTKVNKKFKGVWVSNKDSFQLKIEAYVENEHLKIEGSYCKFGKCDPSESNLVYGPSLTYSKNLGILPEIRGHKVLYKSQLEQLPNRITLDGYNPSLVELKLLGKKKLQWIKIKYQDVVVINEDGQVLKYPLPEKMILFKKE